PRILNAGQWRSHLLERLERQIRVTADPGLEALYDELAAYPGPAAVPDPTGQPAIMVPLRLATAAGDELTFFSTVTTFGTAVDITVAELSVEAFFPADDQTAERLRR
ncbi:MAG: transcriptional regulator, partial [Solirubrobacteraceae bacterium]